MSGDLKSHVTMITWTITAAISRGSAWGPKAKCIVANTARTRLSRLEVPQMIIDVIALARLNQEIGSCLYIKRTLQV
jgi:hypothetical protein